MKIDIRNMLVVTFVFLFIIIFGFNLSGIVFAANDNVTVDVNVSILSEITVTPPAINWTQITPGTAGGMKNITIKNTGSVNVTNLYAYVDTLQNESSRPYGSSNPALYSAGGVLVFKNQTNNAFYWAGRIEWNWTEEISSLDKSLFTNQNNVTAWGFFRNASVSYVWAVATNKTTGLCNETGDGTAVQLGIEDHVDEGTPETRKPNPGSITASGGDDSYAYFSVNRASNLLSTMCVAVTSSCDKIFIYKYDKRPGFTTCTNSMYIQPHDLTPNAIHRVTADVWIPKGIPAGDLTGALWNFVAT
jgi:hypothetical protein